MSSGVDATAQATADTEQQEADEAWAEAETMQSEGMDGLEVQAGVEQH